MVIGAPCALARNNSPERYYLDNGLYLDVNPYGESMGGQAYGIALCDAKTPEIVALIKSILARRLILPDWGLRKVK